MNCIVVVPAAGTGSRFGGEIPKQFVSFRGRPLLAWTISRIFAVEEVERVIVAIRDEDEERMRAMIESESWSRVRWVLGGASRQESVLKAMRAIESESEKIVAVHDAVRPLCTPLLFRSVIEAGFLHGAAIPGLPVADTLYRTEGELLSNRVDRAGLIAAQTPQCFRIELLRPLLERAWHESLVATDEASVLLSYGLDVHVVPGEPSNLKITTPSDLAVAEATMIEGGRT